MINNPHQPSRQHRSRIARRVIAAGVILVALLSIPLTASAEPGWPDYAVRTSVAFSGYGRFNADGDRVMAVDQDYDGYGVAIHWRTNYGRTGVCSNRSGVGEIKVCNYNMSEQGNFKMKACLTNGTRTFACGAESYWIDISSGTIYR